MAKKIRSIKTSEPRLRLLHYLLGFFSLLGVGISSYLVYVHYAGIAPVCLPGTKCELVLTSRYAEVWGLPLSLFGLLTYLTLLVVSAWQLLKRRENSGFAALCLYILALFGTCFSLYLLYLEAFVIHDYCTWCLASGIVMLSLLITSLINLSRAGLVFKELPHYIRSRIKRYVGW